MKIKRNKRIYMDFASATPIDKGVHKVMSLIFKNIYANPVSVHEEGKKSYNQLDKARKRVAQICGVKKEEVIFTSGGTESNNLAVKGFLDTLPKKMNKKVITTLLEHPSVLNTIQKFADDQDNNTQVIYLRVDHKGRINIEEFEKALDQSVVLVSIMYANNEIGNINHIKSFSSAIKKFKNVQNRNDNEMPFLHSDLGQTPLFSDIHLDRLGIHLATIDGAKISGPKGVGALIKKAGVPMKKILEGGGHEFNLRPGTENVAAVCGFGEALFLAQKNCDKRFANSQKIQKYFIQKIQKEIPDVIIIGDSENRLPNNLNICIPKTNSEFATIWLDENGIACSPRTACRNISDSLKSYVIEAIRPECAESSIRFSWGDEIKKKDIDFVVKKIKSFCQKYC